MSTVGLKKKVNPLKRWKVAHYLFFVFIQGLITAHRDLFEALKEEDYETAAICLNLAITLFGGSIAAFKYGTDYSAEEYEKLVRPTMGTPKYSPGFSDLHSVDHTVLLSLMHKLSEFLKKRPQVLEGIYQRYLTALHTLYDSHAYVCEKFVGIKGRSLLQNKSNDKIKKRFSAPDSIRKIYKKRTLKLLGVDL